MHFAAPTEGTAQFAEIIRERFRVDLIRFANSGTEATMRAIRVACGLLRRARGGLN